MINNTFAKYSTALILLTSILAGCSRNNPDPVNEGVSNAPSVTQPVPPINSFNPRPSSGEIQENQIRGTIETISPSEMVTRQVLSFDYVPGMEIPAAGFTPEYDTIKFSENMTFTKSITANGALSGQPDQPITFNDLFVGDLIEIVSGRFEGNHIIADHVRVWISK